MAKQDFPLNIDRRRLLVSAAALAGSGIEPLVEYAEAASRHCCGPTDSVGTRGSGIECLPSHGSPSSGN